MVTLHVLLDVALPLGAIGAQAAFELLGRVGAEFQLAAGQ